MNLSLKEKELVWSYKFSKQVRRRDYKFIRARKAKKRKFLRYITKTTQNTFTYTIRDLKQNIRDLENIVQSVTWKR